jgi:hypothetical protein
VADRRLSQQPGVGMTAKVEGFDRLVEQVTLERSD